MQRGRTTRLINLGGNRQKWPSRSEKIIDAAQSSVASHSGRAQAGAARLGAQWQYRQRTRGHGVFGRDAGAGAGGFSLLCGARRLGFFLGELLEELEQRALPY